jgi:hypothetical protein
MKKYANCPRQVADVEQIRAGNLMKEKPGFYKLEDGDFKQLNNHSPRRQLEFNSANHFYLCDAAKYLCTHHKKSLNFGSINYIETEISWNAFKQITIGKYTQQYPKLMHELNGSQRYCYIPKEDGGYYIMPPFRLDFTTENQEDLSDGQRRKLKNIDAQKIKSVTFSMAKPLFEKYIQNGQYYSHPVNLYAKIYDIVSGWEINNSPKLMSEGGCDPETNYKQLLTSPNFIAGYVRLIDYLYIHGAGTNDRISVSLQDLLSKVMPSLCHINEHGKMKLRNQKELVELLTAATILTGILDGLDYKLKSPPKDDTNKDGYTVFEFDHPQKKQIKTDLKC